LIEAKIKAEEAAGEHAVEKASLESRVGSVQQGAAVRHVRAILTRMIKGELGVRVLAWRDTMKLERVLQQMALHTQQVAEMQPRLKVEQKARREAQTKAKKWCVEAAMNEKKVAELARRLEAVMGYVNARTPTAADVAQHVEAFRGAIDSPANGALAAEGKAEPLAITAEAGIVPQQAEVPSVVSKHATVPADKRSQFRYSKKLEAYEEFKSGVRARSEKMVYHPLKYVNALHRKK
jgi:hypothetical protein